MILIDDHELELSRLTYWVPSTVRRGNCNRLFLVTYDDAFCIEIKRQEPHPLLEDGSRVEIAKLIDGEMAVRKAQ